MALEIILVRHGQADINIDEKFKNKVIGQCQGAELTQAGIEQAKQLGQYFSRKYAPEQFDYIATSQAIRAIMTCHYCFKEWLKEGSVWKKYGITPALNERGQGAEEGKDISQAITEEDKRRRDEDPWNFCLGAGESRKSVFDRVNENVLGFCISNCYQKALLITHGNTIRSILCGLGFFKQHELYKKEVENCSVTNILYKDGAWELAGFNYTGHLRCSQ